MVTFKVGIGKEDIQEGILLPEDWYEMEITRDPYEDKNRAWKNAGENLGPNEVIAIDPKAGKNIVVNLRANSETPEFDGRSLTKWLPLPGPQDNDVYMNDGQPKADWKAAVIYKWVEAFGGTVEGSDASLAMGQKALVYITQGVGMDGETVENSISMNVYPRALGAGLGDGGEVFEEGLL